MFTGSMPKPSPAVEVVEVVGPRQAERRSRIEAEAMEGADLVVRIGAHREALERSRERGPDRVGRPTRIAGRGRPAVVVRRASDSDNAAVVSGAAPDHARPREGDRLPSGQLAARVAPVV